MSKHEIRLRKQRMPARTADRFRNFGIVMNRHEQHTRIKKIIRMFTLFAAILILVMLLVMTFAIVIRIKEKQPEKGVTDNAFYIKTRIK
jgi:hypothetical protein